jgi:hypothetical protein
MREGVIMELTIGTMLKIIGGLIALSVGLILLTYFNGGVLANLVRSLGILG